MNLATFQFKAFIAIFFGMGLCSGFSSPKSDSTDPVPKRFLEEGGLLVIEAEHFASSKPSTYALYKKPHTWVGRCGDSTASGDCYLEVLPDERGEDGRGPASPRDNSGAALEYLIRVNVPGTYRVFVRGRCKGGESNGVHVGLNGVLAGRGPGASNLSGFRPPGAWNWETQRKHGYEGTSVLTLEPGDHVLHVWSRDDGFQLDKVVLSRVAEAPYGKGPTESLHIGGSHSASKAEALKQGSVIQEGMRVP